MFSLVSLGTRIANDPSTVERLCDFHSCLGVHTQLPAGHLLKLHRIERHRPPLALRSAVNRDHCGSGIFQAYRVEDEAHILPEYPATFPQEFRLTSLNLDTDLMRGETS